MSIRLTIKPKPLKSRIKTILLGLFPQILRLLNRKKVLSECLQNVDVSYIAVAVALNSMICKQTENTFFYNLEPYEKLS